ncbi:unnamed protein product [Angiostrongylus costaricensis]|uniref:T-cell immunomodulatory protein n=1 Tax=Angiostrongylus costaricensis TaxID=334426 RepID=A0A0R3PV26_ANGCS|nr:unnamed protein product [Angiostrongylus costaricensis]
MVMETFYTFELSLGKKVPVQFGRVCGFGDFNGDRNTDVIVQRGTNLTILLQDDELLNVIAITFAEVYFFGSSLYSYIVECSLGDFNGDTKLDVLVRNDYHHSVWISSALGDSFVEHKLAAIDVDGNGWHDVLGFYSNRSMYCITFSRSGTPSFDCNYLFPYCCFSDFTTLDPYLGVPHLFFQYVGAPMAADFDADGLIELLVPICRKDNCKQVQTINLHSFNLIAEERNFDILFDEDTLVLFRVGDFSLDGYPDLLATLVIDNIPCTNCDRNGTRRFEINKSVFIQPKEVAIGETKMASFFDLKEDGNLDILLEYKSHEGETKFSFIPCDDKGDVTFLKVTVFTSICGKRCAPSSKELGSGVSWSGACASFSMSDGWGGSLKSSACQIPAVTHRTLAPPYILFGLGRSPNFVDELTIGAPRYSDSLNYRQHTLKQLVPNSRIIVIPPEGNSHWLTRLYVTPSQLILQSLAVIALVCVMLLMVVAFLHYREKKEDRVERQQQSHRFHFDAM